MSADDLLRLAAEREAILDALADGPLTPRDVVDRVGVSRSTFNRAIRDLDDAGLVDRSGGDCRLTLTGRLVLDRYRAARREVEGALAADRALAPLAPDAPVDPAVLVDATVHLGDGSTPYRPKERLHEVVRAADRYRAVLPALDDPRHVRLLYEHVVTDGRPAELLVPPEFADSLADRFPRRLAAMAGSEGFDLRTGEVPPFGLVLAEAEDGDPTVALAVFGDQGIHAVVVTDTDRAREWAVGLLDDCRDRFSSVTEEFEQHTDGGVVVGGVSGVGPELLVDLEREGFVRLSRDFFADRRVADPTTAWRAGLGLAEVHTGYAVERTPERRDWAEDDPREGSGRDAGTLTGRLTDRLRDGEDCVLVGPPGSGKSTTCKRVATEWYAADRGPVLYRESGRGAAFEDVEALLATVEDADGHALVVVEDAVRPGASAVFEAMERRSERGGGSDEDGDGAGNGPAVSFLLDAREREWLDPPGDPDMDRSRLAVETMPSPSDRDYERLVEHFGATAGVEVDVPADRLRERVRSSRAGDEAAPGELLLALHRLATHADPLAEGATSLEEDAAACYESVADAGGTAHDVAVAANLLNAAGLGVYPELLYAVAPADPAGVESAVDLLDGRVLFPRERDRDADPEPYPAVHEAWSAEFLAAFLDAAGAEAARERFGRVLTRLLAVADDADRRERVAEQVDGAAQYLDRVAGDPEEWADDAVERCFALAEERPRLAPLFGTRETATYELPAACSRETRRESLTTRGAAHRHRGALGEARAEQERRLELAREDGDPREEADALNSLGLVARDRSAYDDARDRFEESLALAREAGYRLGEARSLSNLGMVAQDRGEYDTARDRLEESLAVQREDSDRQLRAHTLNNLGTVARRQGEYDAAREYHEGSLAIAREIGNRWTEARALGNLGLVAQDRGEYDTSRTHLERSLAIKRAIGDRKGEANALNNLGAMTWHQGRRERAREYWTECLAIQREVGDRRGEANSLNNLGAVALDQGEYDTAREHFEQSLEIAREIGDPRREAMALGNLGELDHRRDEYDAAADRTEAAAELYRELGSVRGELDHIEIRAAVAAETDDREAAIEWCDRGLARIEASEFDGFDEHRETFEELHPER